MTFETLQTKTYYKLYIYSTLFTKQNGNTKMKT